MGIGAGRRGEFNLGEQTACLTKISHPRTPEVEVSRAATMPSPTAAE